MLGRWISADEDVKGGPRNILLSYPFWRDFLGSDPQVLGKSIRLSGNTYTVIGVMPSSFALPRELADIFVSLWVAYPEAAPDRDVHFMHSYWRLKPGVTLSQAQSEIAEVDRRLAEQFPDGEKGRGTMLVPLHDWLVGNIRPALLILFGSVGLVLLIACANFAMLLMARSVARQRELMIRASLGASNSRLIRQRLTESTLLALLGGALGLVVAKIGTTLLLALKPAALRRFTAIHMDLRVFLFVFAVSLMTGLLFGLLPAWSASRGDIAEALRENSRATGSGASRKSIAQLPGHRGDCPGTHTAGRCRIADQRLPAFALRQSGIQSRQRDDDVPSTAGNPVSRDPVTDEFPPRTTRANQRPSRCRSGND